MCLDVIENLPYDEEVEIAPGYIVERRSVLAGLGGLLLASMPTVRCAAAVADDAATFLAFLEEINPLARALVADTSADGQDRYLRTVAAAAAKLQHVPLPDKWIDSGQGAEADTYRIGFNPGGDPFAVLHWRLEPGAVCRTHAHTYGNVVTVGLEGLTRVRNYEVVGEPDYKSASSFIVTETIDQLLAPGSVNLVSLQRNYIHGFVAGPDGARGLDITTRLKPKPEFGTPYLSIAASPEDKFSRTFAATWVYND